MFYYNIYLSFIKQNCKGGQVERTEKNNIHKRVKDEVNRILSSINWVMDSQLVI